MSGNDPASLLLDGLLMGGVYALVAVGMALIGRVLGAVNAAHGILLAAAMLLASVLAARFGIHPYASLPLMTLLMSACGWLLYRWLIGPVSHGNGRAATLATLGVAAVLDRLVPLVFGGDTRGLDGPYASAVPAVAPKLVGFAVAVLLGGTLWLFLAQTDTGRALRAVGTQPEAARLVGIQPSRMAALAYAIGTGCLGAAGCLLVPGLYVGPQSGSPFMLAALAAVLLGGAGSLPGAVAGGLLVGAAEGAATVLLGQEGQGPALGLVFVAILLLRPMFARPVRA